MRILLIEDDKDLCKVVSQQLNNQGYEVDSCYSGEDALIYALQYEYDLIILDRMLPVLDGLSITQVIRKKNIYTPIIMVTALGSISDRIEGLDAGADDYLIKPFDIEELFARVRALTRRPLKIENIDIVEFSDLIINKSSNTLSCNNKTISLSKKEGELLAFLMKNTEVPVSRERLITHVWGVDSTVEDGNLDNYIHFLRRRLKNIGSGSTIKTIYGIGYQLKE